MSIRKGDHVIDGLEGWKEHAGPRSSGHWADGRSAKEAARAWLAVSSPALPPEVEAALASHPDFGTVRRWEAEPEARVRFDGFGGEPANVDLLVRVEDNRGPFVMAVEAKADETFGRTVAGQLAAARKRLESTPLSKGVAPLEQLGEALFGLPASEVGGLRYQLLTATAAALAAAVSQDADRAVLLVHEFQTQKTTEKKRRQNAADLERFLEALGAPDPSSVIRGGLAGPFRVPGGPLFEGVPALYVGKASRTVGAGETA
jgi:hypothetical protein